MNKSLTEALDVLKDGRVALVNSYNERNSDRYRYSFQYHSSRTAIDTAASLMDHIWIDGILMAAHEKFSNGETSMETLQMVLESLRRSSIFKCKTMMFEGYDTLLKTKILAFGEFLTVCENGNKNKRQLEFDMYRDKVLFEREMEKYSELDKNEI